MAWTSQIQTPLSISLSYCIRWLPRIFLITTTAYCFDSFWTYSNTLHFSLSCQCSFWNVDPIIILPCGIILCLPITLRKIPNSSTRHKALQDSGSTPHLSCPTSHPIPQAPSVQTILNSFHFLKCDSSLLLLIVGVSCAFQLVSSSLSSLMWPLLLQRTSLDIRSTEKPLMTPRVWDGCPYLSNSQWIVLINQCYPYKSNLLCCVLESKLHVGRSYLLCLAQFISTWLKWTHT